MVGFHLLDGERGRRRSEIGRTINWQVTGFLLFLSAQLKQGGYE